MSSEDIYNLLEELETEEANVIGEFAGSKDKNIKDNDYDSNSDIEVENVDQAADITEHGESQEEKDQDSYIKRIPCQKMQIHQ
ncbi:hypothetical protein QE152_g1249 [Popillia japonica]|uniref:Uncharacterized protein n=1 Tax=Popillia japonica TaxID=7064 RepID=A0AAW1N760_POPJA